jgi:thioredoxin 1
MNIKTVTDATFEDEVIRSTGPILVDFWADWCGPCRIVSPALEEIAGELGERLTVVKIDVDDNPVTPARYAVRGIPALLLFKQGEPAATRVGAAPQSVLREWIEASL